MFFKSNLYCWNIFKIKNIIIIIHKHLFIIFLIKKTHIYCNLRNRSFYIEFLKHVFFLKENYFLLLAKYWKFNGAHPDWIFPMPRQISQTIGKVQYCSMWELYFSNTSLTFNTDKYIIGITAYKIRRLISIHSNSRRIFLIFSHMYPINLITL